MKSHAKRLLSAVLVTVPMLMLGMGGFMYSMSANGAGPGGAEGLIEDDYTRATAAGIGALNTQQGYNNSAFGYHSLFSITSGNGNTASGAYFYFVTLIQTH